MRVYLRLSSLLQQRRFQILAAIVIVAVPVLGFLPYLRSMVSRNAVVTAFVYTARAPISGVLVKVPARGGEVVVDGGAAAYVEDPRADDDLVSDLRSRVNALRALVGELEEERRRLVGLEAGQSGRQGDYREAIGRDTENRIVTLRLELRASEARLVQLRNEAARAEKMHEAGLIPPSELEAATAALQSLQATRDAQENEVERLLADRQEIAAGRLSSDSPDAAVHVDDTIERFRLELRAVDRSLTESRAELDSVKQRLERAESRFGNVHRAPVQVPNGVVVWQVHAMPGQFVETGTPVFSFVDCDSLLLDMRLDDSVLGLVESGRTARFRLFGSVQWHEAAVSMVRGSGAVMGAESLATSVPRNPRDGQVLARISAGELIEGPEAFCGIGRKSYAQLHGIGLYHEFARRLFL